MRNTLRGSEHTQAGELSPSTGCVHVGAQIYEFPVPYLGIVKLCWDCRRELVMRLHAFDEFGLIPLDGGRFGYKCSHCNGDYTSDDHGTCTCPGRKHNCAVTRKNLRAFDRYADLVIRKPPADRPRTGKP